MEVCLSLLKMVRSAKKAFTFAQCMSALRPWTVLLKIPCHRTFDALFFCYSKYVLKKSNALWLLFCSNDWILYYLGNSFMGLAMIWQSWQTCVYETLKRPTFHYAHCFNFFANLYNTHLQLMLLKLKYCRHILTWRWPRPLFGVMSTSCGDECQMYILLIKK